MEKGSKKVIKSLKYIDEEEKQKAKILFFCQDNSITTPSKFAPPSSFNSKTTKDLTMKNISKNRIGRAFGPKVNFGKPMSRNAVEEDLPLEEENQLSFFKLKKIENSRHIQIERDESFEIYEEILSEEKENLIQNWGENNSFDIEGILNQHLEDLRMIELRNQDYEVKKSQEILEKKSKKIKRKKSRTVTSILKSSPLKKQLDYLSVKTQKSSKKSVKFSPKVVVKEFEVSGKPKNLFFNEDIPRKQFQKYC